LKLVVKINQKVLNIIQKIM